MEEMRRFRAKFAGKCCKCRGQFPADTEILYWPVSRDAAHVECPKVDANEQASIFNSWIKVLTPDGEEDLKSFAETSPHLSQPDEDFN